jgi:UDPglucose--hexose-1-phosphate uridylyltransferase
MGLAVLPSRLKGELTALAQAIVAGSDIDSDDVLSKHGPWVAELKKQYEFTEENTMDILLQETGKVFAQVLEDAGVYKNDEAGRKGFLRFVDAVNNQ